MQGTLMEQGVELMVFGMGTVFVFLAVLVFATRVMSALAQRYAPEAPPVSTLRKSTVGRPTEPGDDEHLIAVISAAVQKYRSRQK